MDANSGSEILEVLLCSAVPVASNPDTFLQEFLAVLKVELSPLGFVPRIHLFLDGSDVRECGAHLDSVGATHCLLYAPRDNLLVPVLDDLGVTWLVVFPRAHLYSNCVVLDSQYLVKLQLEHLFGLGHRRIAYMDPVCDPYPNITAMHRRESYYRLMAEHGCKVESGWVVRGTYDREGVAQAVECMLRTVPRPTAIIVKDVQLEAVYDTLTAYGLRVPEDMSVVATDDLPICSQVLPPATSTCNLPALAVRAVVDMLRALMEGNEPERPQYFPVSLSIRESTASVPEDRGE